MVTPGNSVENIQLSEDQSNHKNCLFHAYFGVGLNIILIILYCGGVNRFSGPVNEFIIHYTYMLL